MRPEVPSESTVRDLTVLADALWQAEKERAPPDPLTDDMFADTVADNASSARIVLGARITPGERLDLRLLGALFSRNGTWRRPRHCRSVCIGTPATAVAWLAGAMAARDEQLTPGSVVLTGGLTASTTLTRARRIVAEFDGLGSVEVQCG